MANPKGVKKDDLFCIEVASEWMAIRTQKGCWHPSDTEAGELRMQELEDSLIERFGAPRGRELISRMKQAVYR